MNIQIETFERREIFYHPEIIDVKHREDCVICQTAVFLINELAHTGDF